MLVRVQPLRRVRLRGHARLRVRALRPSAKHRRRLRERVRVEEIRRSRRERGQTGGRIPFTRCGARSVTRLRLCFIKAMEVRNLLTKHYIEQILATSELLPHNVDFDKAADLKNGVNNGNEDLSSSTTTTFVITDGPNAVHHFEFSRGQCVEHVEAVKVERVEAISDTIGAGDSFVAGYLSAQLKGGGVWDSIEEGVRRMTVLSEG